jgi:hypothetical protein
LLPRCLQRQSSQRRPSGSHAGESPIEKVLMQACEFQLLPTDARKVARDKQKGNTTPVQLPKDRFSAWTDPVDKGTRIMEGVARFRRVYNGWHRLSCFGPRNAGLLGESKDKIGIQHAVSGNPLESATHTQHCPQSMLQGLLVLWA